MEQFIPFILFLIGFVMIIKGSDWFIDAVTWIARLFKVSELIIGATLVSLCTTLPETMVSANSALKGNTQIAIGNAFGSIACNTGLILAITILFARPKFQERKSFQKRGLILIGLLVLTFLIALFTRELSRFTGVIFLCILLWYLYFNINESKKRKPSFSQTYVDRSLFFIIKNILYFVIGLALTLYGSNLLVTNGEIIASVLGVPDIVIGLTMTAFGTSLPELVTAITAIRKKVHNISLGNILGANILNIILVTGLSATILPIPVNNTILFFHIPALLIITGSVVLSSFINKEKLNLGNGIFLLSVYSVYIFITIS
jgi:cation:H+ antiporter